MQPVSAQRMREIDQRCIQDLGIPGAVLMNNAGAAVFKEVQGGPVLVVCGKGNNGGDGFVVARYCLDAGMDTTVLLLAHPEDIAGDASVFLQAYLRLGGHMIVADSPELVLKALDAMPDPGTVVDAILGTGAKGEVREPARTVLQHWPTAYTLAVDLPSGLDADTGLPGPVCVRADVTVTLHLPKTGFSNPRAAEFLGRIIVADIGIPHVCNDDAAWGRLKLPPCATTP